MKWSCSGHVEHDRCTSRVSLMDTIRQDQPSSEETTWTNTWSGTIWQRTAQDRLTWRRPNDGTLRLPNDDDDDHPTHTYDNYRIFDLRSFTSMSRKWEMLTRLRRVPKKEIFHCEKARTSYQNTTGPFWFHQKVVPSTKKQVYRRRFCQSLNKGSRASATIEIPTWCNRVFVEYSKGSARCCQWKYDLRMSEVSSAHCKDDADALSELTTRWRYSA